MGHQQIEEEDIRLECVKESFDVAGICCCLYIGIALKIQQSLNNINIGLIIINNKDIGIF